MSWYRLAISAVALATHSHAEILWNGKFADAQHSDVGAVAGPAPSSNGMKAVWGTTFYSTGYSSVDSMSMPNTSLVLAVGVAATTGGTLSPNIWGVDATSGEILYNTPLPQFTRDVTYFYTVPSVLVTTARGVFVVSGQGWRFDNGTESSVIYACDVSSGSLAWYTDFLTTVVSDVVPGTDGSVFVTASDGGLRAITGDTGVQRWYVPIFPGESVWTRAYTPKLALSPDGSHVAAFNGSTLLSVDTTSGQVSWVAPSLSWADTYTLTWDSQLNLILLPNRTSLVAFNGDSGAVVWVASPFPDPRTLGPVTATAVPKNAGVVFVYATIGNYSSSAGALYAFDKSSGNLIDRLTWDPDQYAAWGYSLVLDCSNPSAINLYFSVLGPHVEGLPSVTAQDDAMLKGMHRDRSLTSTGQSRRLQAGGSVYAAQVVFSGQKLKQISLAPYTGALQCGFVRLAVGPAAGQLLANCNAQNAAIEALQAA